MEAKLLLAIVPLALLVLSPVGCLDDTKALAEAIASELAEPGPDQSSKCCDYIGRFCKSHKETCVDFIKPPTLALTCRCVTTLEYKVKRYLDKCFKEADKKIILRMKKELARMVIRKLPDRTLGSLKTNHYPAGKNPGSGAKKPSKVNRINSGLKGIGF